MLHVMFHLAATFNIHPDPNAPGVSGIKKATNSLAEWSLLAAGVGAAGSLIAIGIGHGLHLSRVIAHGKEGFVVSLIVAFLVASLGALLTMAYGL